MKKAVQFGAGGIGRGFLGQLFHESGREVVFVDVVPAVVDLINSRRRYTIRFACDPPEEILISNISALRANDIQAASEELALTDIACTAVGVNALSAVAPVLASGIIRRAEIGNDEPLNVIICENLARADVFLRGKVKELLPSLYHDYLDTRVGFVMSVVARMVPVMTEDAKLKDPLLVVVERYKKLPVDKGAFIGRLPDIIGFEPCDNFQAYVDDKLFTHNCGHAVAAYFGWLRGHEFMHRAMRDEAVRESVESALSETGQALVTRYGLDPALHKAHIDDLMTRFANPALADQVARVGRDPLRKLGPGDRLVGAARFALAQGVIPSGVCAGIAAGLFFDPPGDPTSSIVQSVIRARGVEAALGEVCGLEKHNPITGAVIESYNRIKIRPPVDGLI